MRIYKNPLDKREFNPIIRQTGRISLSFSAARSLIMPEIGRAASTVQPWVRRAFLR